MHQDSWAKRNLGFGSLDEYTKQLKSTPQLLQQHAGRVQGTDTQQQRQQQQEQLLLQQQQQQQSQHQQQEPAGKAVSNAALDPELNGIHLALLGIGMMAGSGVFIAAGTAAHLYAGPAIVVSFLVAGISALLSSLCYSEFAAAKPCTGAFSYVLGSLGGFLAFLVGATLLMAYVTVTAALARAFTPYFGLMMNQTTLDGMGWGTFQNGNVTVDVVAGVLVVAMCLLVVSSTSGSSWFNIIITISQLLVVVTLAVGSVTRMDTTAIVPYMPFGWQGIIKGAAYVFFSFLGFDAVSALAPETREPARGVRRGMISSVATVTFINMVMSQCLILMVPYGELDPKSSWPFAFVYRQYFWGKFLAAFGACLGLIPPLLVAIMAASRILAALARTHMLMPLLGRTSPILHTPWPATLALGAITTPIAMLLDAPDMVNLVSASALVVFGVVAVAALWRRYWRVGPGLGGNAAPAGLILGVVLCSIANGVAFAVTKDWLGIAGAGGAQLLLTAALAFGCKQACAPTRRVPLFAFIASTSIFLNGLLASTLPAAAYVQLAIFLAAALAVYLLYSLPALGNQQLRVAKAGTAAAGGAGQDQPAMVA